MAKSWEALKGIDDNTWADLEAPDPRQVAQTYFEDTGHLLSLTSDNHSAWLIPGTGVRIAAAEARDISHAVRAATAEAALTGAEVQSPLVLI